MILAKMFVMGDLITALFKDYPHRLSWRRSAEIVREDTLEPNRDGVWKVRLADRWLRYSKGPRQGHFWDICGDDYQTAELALVALLEADPPQIILSISSPVPETQHEQAT